MHKTEAANLFKVLSDEDRVKMVKKLYMLKSLSFDDFKNIIGSTDEKLKNDISILLDANMINLNEKKYTPNFVLIDELMNFIKTPCNCHTKKTKFIVTAYDLDFVFEKDGEDLAWYDFDHMVSKNGKATLRIDANRDAYAFYRKDENAEEIQGTIRDDEDNILADNYGIDNNNKYHFVKSRKQGYFD